MSTSPRLLFLLALIELAMIAPCVAQKAIFSIVNHLDIDRPHQLIILKRNDIEKKTGTIRDGKFVEIKDTNGNKVIVQFDSLHDAKKWNEAAFLYSFKPKTSVVFYITVTDERNSDTVLPLANVRLRKKDTNNSFGGYLSRETMPIKNRPTDFSKQPLPLYLTEGPAWENDKVAFRLYLDTRNGKDIFGKIVPAMVMDTIGENINNSYHQLSGWGMDILHVGNSLGAGSIAFRVKENGRDTLIRLGGKNITHEVYRQIAKGPVRAIFQVSYDWILAGKNVQVIDETSIWGGQYFYETKITINNALSNIELVTGIADFFDNKSGHFIKDSAAILYSYGKQSENHDYLGMAIFIPRANFIRTGETPKENHEGPVVYKPGVFDTHFISQTIEKGKPAVYRFYSSWEKTDTNFASIDYFETFLKKEAALFSNPIQIKW